MYVLHSWLNKLTDRLNCSLWTLCNERSYIRPRRTYSVVTGPVPLSFCLSVCRSVDREFWKNGGLDRDANKGGGLDGPIE